MLLTDKATPIMKQNSNATGEVSGKYIFTLIDQKKHDYQKIVSNLLTTHGITNPTENSWYNLEDYVMVFEDIMQQFGVHLIYVLGESIGKDISFGTNIHTLEDALSYLNTLYHSYHRGEDIGYFNLQYFDYDKKEALVQCNNPYPCCLNKGILNSLIKRFRMWDACSLQVEKVNNSSRNMAENSSCTYAITWT